MNKIYLVIFFLISFSWIHAQDGPGGVGSTDGSSKLMVWLDASSMNNQQNDTIKNWLDLSGKQHHFQSLQGAIFNKSAQNNSNTITFDGKTFFDMSSTASLSNSSFSLISVSNPKSTNTNKCILSNAFEDTLNSIRKGISLMASPTSNFWNFWSGKGNVATWNILSSNFSTANSWASQSIEYNNAIGGGKTISLNGKILQSDTNSIDLTSTRSFRLGAGYKDNAVDYFFEGDMSEIILFSSSLNKVESILVQNYLSAKYNYPLVSYDIYKEDDAINGHYDYDVAGVGKLDTFIQNNSKGTGNLRLYNMTSMQQNQFAIWGHNGGIDSLINETDVPSGIKSRIAREWKINMIDTSNNSVNIGSFDLEVDLSKLNIIAPMELRLIIDENNNGFFSDDTAIVEVSGMNGNFYLFKNLNRFKNHTHFTFAYKPMVLSATPSETKIDQFYAVSDLDKKVLLSWIASKEFQNDFFIIEKSYDMIHWNFLDKVISKGNSIQSQEYQIVDSILRVGTIYYRLSNVDIFGDTSFLSSSSVYVKPTFEAKLGANPADKVLEIYGKEVELSEIQICNSKGEVMFTNIDPNNSSNKIEIDITKLNSGVYFLKTKNQVMRFLK